MTSKDDSKAKKRTGRKRLPPLAPGPALQFVVASHPDDFKADDTMRNIRSHVMYKHRDQQGRSRSPSVRSLSGRSSRPMSMARTPSPMAFNTEGTLEDSNFLAPPRRRDTIWDFDFYQLMSQSSMADPARNLATRIIAAATAKPARSAPPTFDQGAEYPFPGSNTLGEDSLEDLKNLYIDQCGMSQDRGWMEAVCSTHMSFLSTLCVHCVHLDLAEGRVDDSQLTVIAKNQVMRMIGDSLNEASTSTDDSTALSILHLLISENGCAEEHAFNWHYSGLLKIVNQRGGIRELGMNGQIATFLSTVVLTFSILRGHSEPSILRDFIPSRRQSILTEQSPPVSPLFAPHGNLDTLYGKCSEGTFQILHDMHELTRMFTLQWDYASDMFSPQSNSDMASYDTHMQQIYTRLFQYSSTDSQITPDYIYESCRLAALIYCRSIFHGAPFSESANVIHAQNPDLGFSGETLLTALYRALERTEDRTGHWGNMSGVYYWICLVGGAASFQLQPPMYEQAESHKQAALIKKFFSSFAVKGALSFGLEQAAATIETQRTMLKVQNFIKLKRASSQ